MAKTTPSFQKLLKHPDREEVISKLCLGIDPKDIHDWLNLKYQNASEHKFVISTATLKSFQDNYLDVYIAIRDDFANAKTAMATGATEDLVLSVGNNATYKALVMKTVGQELDLKQAIAGLIAVIELRLGQVFDVIQEDPRNINTRIDRVLIEYCDKLGLLIEKAQKIINGGADTVIQHNVSIQHIDQQTSVFYESIRRVLSKMDLEKSMLFMEAFTEEMGKVKDPMNRPTIPVETRLAEVKVLNETINQRINP